MIRSLLVTLKKRIRYCKSVEVKSNCVCSMGQEEMTVFCQTFSDVQVFNVSTKGRFLVSEHNYSRHEKVDVKRVAMEIQENDNLSMNLLDRRPVLSVEATFFRHLYRNCSFCTYFTNEIGALGYQCPHCRRGNWASPGLYIAQTRRPEQQPMRSVWYRSSLSCYMVTDDLESYPLSQHKEMCLTSDFLPKERGLRLEAEYKKTRDCLRPDEVLKRLGMWEDHR